MEREHQAQTDRLKKKKRGIWVSLRRWWSFSTGLIGAPQTAAVSYCTTWRLTTDHNTLKWNMKNERRTSAKKTSAYSLIFSGRINITTHVLYADSSLVNDFTLNIIIYNNKQLQRFGPLAQNANLIIAAHYMPGNPGASCPLYDMQQTSQCSTK